MAIALMICAHLWFIAQMFWGLRWSRLQRVKNRPSVATGDHWPLGTWLKDGSSCSVDDGVCNKGNEWWLARGHPQRAELFSWIFWSVKCSARDFADLQILDGRYGFREIIQCQDVYESRYILQRNMISAPKKIEQQCTTSNVPLVG